MTTPKYRYENVKCTRVVDGDTIDVIIDFGFKLTLAMRLRLSRINAPETRGKEKEQGLVSKQKLITLIEGKDIIIETEKQGKYGRYLAEIYYGSMNINDWLVEKEFANYKSYGGTC
jgi:micrococcal nuclease